MATQAQTRHNIKYSPERGIFAPMHAVNWDKALMPDDENIKGRDRYPIRFGCNKHDFVSVLFGRYKTATKTTATPMELRLVMALLSMFSLSRNYNKPVEFSIRQYDLWDLTTPHDRWLKSNSKKLFRDAINGLDRLALRYSVISPKENKDIKHMWFGVKSLPKDRTDPEETIEGWIHLPISKKVVGKKAKLAGNNTVLFSQSLKYVNSFTVWKAFWVAMMLYGKPTKSGHVMYAAPMTQDELTNLIRCSSNQRAIAAFRQLEDDDVIKIHKIPKKSFEKAKYVFTLPD